MQVARIKMKIGNSKLNKYIPVRVKAPSFVIKGDREKQIDYMINPHGQLKTIPIM